MAATRVVRSEETVLKRRIASLYEQCAEDMEREILRYGEDSLTGRRAAAIQESMQGYVHRLWQEIGNAAQRAVRRGADLGTASQVSLLDDALAGIGITTSPSFASVFARTQDEAVAAVLNGTIYAGKHAGLSRRIWNNEALQAGNIEQIIAAAVAEGRSAPQLARDLEAYVNPKALMPDHWNDIYPCSFNYKVDYNAKRLAVTALNHAYYQGAVMAARQNPYAEFLHWELSSGHEIYDVCDLYMEHDEGLGLGNFSLDNAPLPHPFCRCTWYIDSSKSLDEIGNELGRWIGGEKNDRLDEAFGEWKQKIGLPEIYKPAIMKWQNASFSSDELLNGHFAKHQTEFSEITIDSYLQKARELLMSQDTEVLELYRSDGSLARYKPSTNEFVVGVADGTIRTYFVPASGKAYWIEELKRNGKEPMPGMWTDDSSGI